MKAQGHFPLVDFPFKAWVCSSHDVYFLLISCGSYVNFSGLFSLSGFPYRDYVGHTQVLAAANETWICWTVSVKQRSNRRTSITQCLQQIGSCLSNINQIKSLDGVCQNKNSLALQDKRDHLKECRDQVVGKLESTWIEKWFRTFLNFAYKKEVKSRNWCVEHSVSCSQGSQSPAMAVLLLNVFDWIRKLSKYLKVGIFGDKIENFDSVITEFPFNSIMLWKSWQKNHISLSLWLHCNPWDRK